MAQSSDHPVQLSVDYPESSNRVTVLFRLILAIPILFLSGLFTSNLLGQFIQYLDRFMEYLPGDIEQLEVMISPETAVVTPVAVLFTATLLVILFRKKYPRWWFDFGLELRRFSTRVSVYVLMMQDAYPSTDEHQSVHLDIEYPDDLNRWLPLVKWILAIPHYIVLVVLGAISVVVVFVAWFAILFTGRYPRPLFDFVVGVGRWFARVDAYAVMLATDEYPPFRLSP